MDGPSSGLETVDVHHRVQASLVDLVEQLLRQDGDRALAEETITRLVDFTHAHFETEENLMRRYGYPNGAAHSAEHEALMASIRRIQAVHAEGGRGGAERAGELRTWLTDHIRGMDAAFIDWCGTQNVHVG